MGWTLRLLSEPVDVYKRQTLYHPFDKIEWAFELFFYIMVLMAVAAAISGAASALNNYFTINYYIGEMCIRDRIWVAALTASA